MDFASAVKSFLPKPSAEPVKPLPGFIGLSRSRQPDPALYRCAKAKTDTRFNRSRRLVWWLGIAIEPGSPATPRSSPRASNSTARRSISTRLSPDRRPASGRPQPNRGRQRHGV